MRPGDVGQVAIEDLFHQWIAARYHIADHEDIRLEIKLFNAETFDQLYALCFQLRAHRRIHIGVTSRDAIAGLLCKRRDAAHERAADAKDVYCR